MYIDHNIFNDLVDKIVIVGFSLAPSNFQKETPTFNTNFWAGILKIADTSTIKLEPFTLSETFLKNSPEVAKYLQSLEPWVVPCSMYFGKDIVTSLSDIMERNIKTIG